MTGGYFRSFFELSALLLAGRPTVRLRSHPPFTGETSGGRGFRPRMDDERESFAASMALFGQRGSGVFQ